jgi:hypothetical protein
MVVFGADGRVMFLDFTAMNSRRLRAANNAHRVIIYVPILLSLGGVGIYGRGTSVARLGR